MKILYFYQYFATPNGSWGTRAYEFARRWAAEGDRVTIVTGVYDKSDLRPGRGLVTRLEVDGIDVRVVNVVFSNKHGLFRRAWSFLVYSLVAAWYGLTYRADVVLASSGPMTVALPALVSRLVWRTSMVLEVRDVWPDVVEQMGVLRHAWARSLARKFVRFCYRSSGAIVALSPGMRDWILRDYGQLPVETVTNAADTELFGNQSATQPLPEWTRGKKLVLFTGTIGAANACEQVTAAAARLHERGRHDIAIILIGDGSARRRLQSEAVASGLTNVHFVDPVPKTELVSWVHAASCVLLVLKPIPIFDTSSPNKLFDALAAGKPVVQTTQGWIRDLLRSRECGITVPPFDDNALADALETLIDDDGGRRKMECNALEAAKEFEMPVLAGKMRSVLASVA